jgi:hypothetical protein
MLCPALPARRAVPRYAKQFYLMALSKRFHDFANLGASPEDLGESPKSRQRLAFAEAKRKIKSKDAAWLTTNRIPFCRRVSEALGPKGHEEELGFLGYYWITAAPFALP